MIKSLTKRKVCKRHGEQGIDACLNGLIEGLSEGEVSEIGRKVGDSVVEIGKEHVFSCFCGIFQGKVPKGEIGGVIQEVWGAKGEMS